MINRLFAGVALLSVISGCAAPSKVVTQERRTAEPFAWTGSVTAGDVLEVKGVNGTVRAVPGTSRSVRVTATRSGRRSDPALVEIVVVEHSGGATICAVYPARGRTNRCEPGAGGDPGTRNNDVTVEFTVEVPTDVDFVGRTTNGDIEADGLAGRVEVYSTNGDLAVKGGRSARARTTNGSVTIRSAGEADARTTNGTIFAQLGALTGSEPLVFSTTNGAIKLGLPSSVNASIDASTSNGRIVSELPVTVHGRVRRNRLAGTIGRGGREITIRTTNGTIELERGS